MEWDSQWEQITQTVVETWRPHHNHRRSHSSAAYDTRAEFAAAILYKAAVAASPQGEFAVLRIEALITGQIQNPACEGNEMTWDDYYEAWHRQAVARRSKRPASDKTFRLLLREARQRVADNTPEDWAWLGAALEDNEKKWFVLAVFQTVPKRLLHPMLRAAVSEKDVSANQRFLSPCLRSYGPRQVIGELLRYLEGDTDFEKAGAVAALYWAFGSNGDESKKVRREDIGDLGYRFRVLCLRNFVQNEDENVRRHIVPMLELEPAIYPEELQPLISQAIRVARQHRDPYIRHRSKSSWVPAGRCLPYRTGNRYEHASIKNEQSRWDCACTSC